MSSLTIIIPTKNRPAHLERALRPLASFGESVEVVIVDDGSLALNRLKNERICSQLRGSRYLPLPHSQGAPAARNRGVHASSGTYLWFLDDDDHASLRTARDALKAVRSHVDQRILLMPRAVILNGVLLRLDVPADESDKWERYRRIGIEVTTSCALFPRAIIDRLGGWDESLPAMQDADLFLRAAQIARFACLRTEPVRIDLGSPNRITHALVKSQLGKLKFLRKHWRVLPLRRRLRYLVQLAGCSPLFRAPRARWWRLRSQLCAGLQRSPPVTGCTGESIRASTVREPTVY